MASDAGLQASVATGLPRTFRAMRLIGQKVNQSNPPLHSQKDGHFKQLRFRVAIKHALFWIASEAFDDVKIFALAIQRGPTATDFAFGKKFGDGIVADGSDQLG